MTKEPAIHSQRNDARPWLALLATAIVAAVAAPLSGCLSQPARPAAWHSAFGTGAEHDSPDSDVSTIVAQRKAQSAERQTPTFERGPRGREIVRVSSRPWQYGGAEGQRIQTPNYVIHTTASRNDFLQRLPAFYEAVLVHYTTALGKLPMPQEPLVTYLFQSRSQWQLKTNEMLPEQAGIFGTLGRGGFTTGGTAVLYYIDHPRRRDSRDTFAIAAHEGWHQYTQSTFKHHLPIWLEEGIATYMESFSLARDGSPQFQPWTNSERRAALFEAARGDNLIPLAELVRRSPQSFLESGKHRLLTYYAQVWALTRFLIEWEDGYYRPALEEALQDAAAGRMAGRLSSSPAISTQRRRSMAATTRSGPWLILEYFNKDFDAFEEQYQQYVLTLMHRGR